MGSSLKGSGVSKVGEGRIVARDCKRARKLYRLPAATNGGTIFVYQPPVKRGGRGMVVPIDKGPKVAGLEEARRRLHELDLSSHRCAKPGATASTRKLY